MGVALESARASGARILSISGPELLVPMYIPDLNERDAKSSALVQAIRECDGLIIAVGLIACAGGWQAGAQTLAALRSIVHALRGWPTPLGASLNTSTGIFDASGHCVDLSSKMQLESIGKQVVEFARMRHTLNHPAGKGD